MTDNEKLIEEAREAFTEAWEAEDRRVENEDRDARGTHSRSRAGIRAALAVFEKAHTPTDDEREALIDAEGWPVADVVDVVMTRWSNDNDQIRRNVGGWMWRSLASSAIQSLAQAGLLRRSGAEPQGEPSDAQVLAAARAYCGDEMTPEEWEWVQTQPDVFQPYLDGMRLALRASAAVS